MPAGDVYRVTLDQSYADTGVTVQNVLFFKLIDPDLAGEGPGAVLAGRLRDLSLAGSGAWYDHRFSLSNQFLLNEIRAQRVYADLEGATVVSVGMAGRRTSGGALPSICAMILRLYSTRISRRGQGRLYLGGLAIGNDNGANGTNLASSGRWDGWPATHAVALGNHLIDTFNGVDAGSVGFVWGVWSKAIAGPTAPYSDGFAPLDHVAVDYVVRAQRRREVGVGA